MTIHVIRHVPFEGPGMIRDYCREKNIRLEEVLLFKEDSLPELEPDDRIVVMGGPMGTSDTEDYPFLVREKEWLSKAVGKNIPVLGICLGAQLLSEIIGGRVTSNGKKEIGWFPVFPVKDNPLFPEEISVLHWHGDIFSIPEGADHLLKSELCPHQAFIKNGIFIGLQFHLEMTLQGAEDLINVSADELSLQEKGIQSVEMIKKGPFETTKTHLYRLLDFWMEQ